VFPAATHIQGVRGPLPLPYTMYTGGGGGCRQEGKG